MNTSNSIDTNDLSVGTPSGDSNFPLTDARQYGPSYWEVLADHYEQSSYYPQYEHDTARNWCPAYWAKGCDGRAHRMELVAAVMAFDIPEHDAVPIIDWLFVNMLTGMSHPLPLDEHRIPHCRVILSLDRPVSTRTYTVLWHRIAHEVFQGVPNPIHADCRTFCDYPDLTGGTKLMRHDANALYVDGALALPSMSGTALGCVSDLNAQLRWDNEQ